MVLLATHARGARGGRRLHVWLWHRPRAGWLKGLRLCIAIRIHYLRAGARGILDENIGRTKRWTISLYNVSGVFGSGADDGLGCCIEFHF